MKYEPPGLCECDVGFHGKVVICNTPLRLMQRRNDMTECPSCKNIKHRTKMKDAPEGFYYGWYSEQSADRNGSILYAGVCNNKVEVTMISQTKDHGAKWKDLKFVGFVNPEAHLGRSKPDPDPYANIPTLP